MNNIWIALGLLALGVGLGAGVGLLLNRQARQRVQGLQEELQSVQAAAQESASQRDLLSTSTVRLETQLAAASDRITEWSTTAKTANEALDRTRQERDVALQQNSALSQQVEDLQANIAVREAAENELQQKYDAIISQRDDLLIAQARLKTYADTHERLHDQEKERADALHGELRQSHTAREELIQANTRLDAEKKAVDRVLLERDQATEQLRKDFELLANRIFEEKTGRFKEDSKTALDGLLAPLAEQIKGFQEKVEKVYVDERGERLLLKDEVTRLALATAGVTAEANNLATALRGDTQTQGAWGEFILERLLESAGLQRDQHYRVQETLKDEDGKSARPDVIVDLPDSKHVIVDSKMSLTAYERYCASENEEDRASLLRQHVGSITTHIRDLQERDYTSLYGIKSPDFVLMFVPLESAFIAAMREEPQLIQEALQRNVLIVCPSTLLVTLRIIANMWRLEAQNRNTKEIVRLAGLLFDKFVNFTQDMAAVGERLTQARDSHEAACSKLHSGKGNLVITAQKIKDLGVRPNKALPEPLLELAIELDEESTLGSSEPARG